MQFGVMIVVITVIRDSAFSIVTDYAKGLWFASQEGATTSRVILRSAQPT